ncbi:MAG: ATP synthase F0 subunit C [Myxococcota bacterium]
MKKNMKNIMSAFVLITVSLPAFAETAQVAPASMKGWYALAAALAIGLPALAGALAQGRTAAAALEGIARNPEASGKIFVPMILGLAMIESLVLFGLIMAFMLSANI